MKKGSLTIFFSLIMVSVMTLTFTLAELIRVNAMVTAADSITKEAAENCFSEFNAYLWKNYHIMAIDIGYGSADRDVGTMRSRISKFANNNADPVEGVNLQRMESISAAVDNFGLLTDYGAKPVIYEGVKAAKGGLLSAVIDEIRAETNIIDTTEKIPDEDVSNGRASIAAAKEACRAEKEAAEAEGREVEEWAQNEPQEVDDNPMDAFDALKQSIAGGILSTVVDDMGGVSQETIDLGSSPSKRENYVGSSLEIPEVSEIDKVLYGQYMLTNMGYYSSDVGHDGLKYEVEYVIAGKASDKENLAAVAERLLLIREAVNCAAILTDPELHESVSAMAGILSGGNIGLVPIIEAALIAAWAYVESIMEVRTLLINGKVAFTKNSGNWNCDLWHLSTCLGPNAKARSVDNGISYGSYLRSFIVLQSMDELGLRSCDVFENALHTQQDYMNTYMDNMLYKADMSVSFMGKPLFYSLLGENVNSLNVYEFTKKRSLSY